MFRWLVTFFFFFLEKESSLVSSIINTDIPTTVRIGMEPQIPLIKKRLDSSAETQIKGVEC